MSGTSNAQPDFSNLRAAPKTEEAPQFDKMLPAQRHQFMQQARELKLRATVANFGFSKARTDLVISFAKEKDEAALLKKKSRQRMEAITRPEVPEEQFAKMLSDFQAVVAMEKDWRQILEKDLDA